MNVVNRQEAEKPHQKSPSPEKGFSRSESLMGGGGWWVKGKETPLGFFAGRFAFVIVGSMVIIMTLISCFMLWVSTNEPYLQPSITDETLHVNKVYLQFDGSTTFQELAMGNQPADIIDAEVLQVSPSKPFKVIFTPKQLDIPERYQVKLRETGQEPAGVFSRQPKFLKETIDGSFYSLTLTPNAPLPAGKYEIEFPDSGMFGGKWFAYFTINGK